jgi:SAM-dependent methyltransferase
MPLIDANGISGQNRIWGKRFSCTAETPWTTLKRDRFFEDSYRCITGCFPERISSVIEVGCGSGRHVIEWARSHPEGLAVGLDRSHEVCEKLTSDILAGKRVYPGNLKIIEADIFRNDLTEGGFDAAFSEGVIEHYRPDEQVEFIRQCMRITSPGGVVAAGAVNFFCPSVAIAFACNGIDWRNVEGREHLWRYGYEQPLKHNDVKDVFHKAGLADVRIESGWLPWYGLKVYRWDEQQQQPIYPWFRPGLIAMQRALEPITDIFDLVSNGNISKWFGYEFVVSGIKE